VESVPPGLDAVVVDNASTDASLAPALAARPQTQVIANTANRGFAGGVNQGVAATAAPYVFLLNPDAELSATALAMLERALDAEPKAGAVGGYVNDQYLPRPIATPWTVVRENLGFPSPPDPGVHVGQAAAAALLIRRTAFDAIGGFDERFTAAWYEDVDFCKRLHDGGWTVLFAREARFAHAGGYGARRLGPAGFAAAYYRNQLRYVRKHYGAAGTLPVRASLVAGMLARVLASPGRAGACGRVAAGALGRW
jgi:GT2 family glycosyltransferase